MKKIDWQEFFANLIFVAILGVLFAIGSVLDFIEENYKLSSYLWIFNIAVLIVTPFYYFKYSIKERIKTKKIEKNVIIKNMDFKYYRDIIEKYSPAVLSFILDGTEFNKDLGASIIYLINKGYLELQDDNKIVRTDKDCSSLSGDLQIICNSDINHLLAFRKFKKKSIEEEKRANIAGEITKQWIEQIEKEAVEEGLVVERKEYKMTSLLSILCILEVIYTLMFEFYGLHFFSWFLVLMLVFLKSWAYDKNKWIKTQKGYEIYKKIVGLKNYIKNYSLLSEKELKDIVIWDDYLIYAIIFNDTSKLNKEADEFYKKVCNIE